MDNLPTTFSESWKQYKSESKILACFASHILDCEGNIIHAHSIQRSGILSQLEDERKGGLRILSIEDFISGDPEEFVVDFKLTGKKKASIFTGFCGKHDVELFSPIENESFSLSEKQLFLFYYRGFAHYFHNIAEQCKFRKYRVRGLKALNEEAQNYINLLKTEYKVFLDLYRCGAQMRKRLNTMLINDDFSLMNHHCRFVPYKRIASSQIIIASHTYSDIPLRRHESISQVMLTVIPDIDNNRTIITLSWFVDDIKGIQYVSELKELADNEFTQAISSAIMSSGMNTYFAPSLWESFSPEERKVGIDEINYLIHHGHNHGSFFHSKINFFR